jgi:TolA-binding protein
MAKIKRSFGIYQDGDDIKVALLRFEQNQVFIDRLYKDSLNTGEKEEEHSSGDYSYQDDFKFDEIKSEPEPDFDFDMPLPDENDDTPFDEITEEIEEEEDESTQFILADIAREVELHQAPLALNLDIANVYYSLLDIPPKTNDKKLLNLVKQNFAETETSGAAMYSFVKGQHSNALGIMHEGHMDLLENLYDLSNQKTSPGLTFSKIIPDEVALINAVNYNYDIPEDDVVAIFYVGDDYSRVTFMQNGLMMFAFPIINEGFRSVDVLNTLYSRYRLEKSHSELPDPNHYFVAGNVDEHEAVTLLRNFEPDLSINLLLPRIIEVSEIDEGEAEYSNDELAGFIIPISMALSVLLPENKKIPVPDLLPKVIKDEQNNLSIGFGGLFVLALILGVSLLAVQLNWSGSRKVKNYSMEIEQLKNSIEANAALIDSLHSKERKIQELEENVARVNKFMGSKNQWHYILEEISNSFLNNPLSWGINLHKEDDKFRISGSTTKRINIVAFSQLFPGGKIVKVVQRDVQGYKVWDFDILFNMPDPIMTKRLDLQREGITYKKEKKKEKKKEPEKKVKEKIIEKPKVSKPKPVEKPKVDLYKQAVIVLFKGKHQQALKLFNQFLNDNPGYRKANAIYFKGECYFGLESYNEAIKMFENVLELNKGKQHDALMMLGNCYFNLNNYEMAKKYWNRLLRVYPHSEYAEIAKSKLKNLNNTDEKVLPPANKKEDVNPDKMGKKNTIATAKKVKPVIKETPKPVVKKTEDSPVVAEPVVVPAPVTTPADPIPSEPLKAVNKNYDRKKLMATHSDYKTALSYYHKKEYEKAIVAFGDYISKNDNPLIINAAYYLGESCYALEKFGLAKYYFENVLSYNKAKLAESYFMLGNVLIKLGDKQEAIKTWEELIKRFPTSAYSKQAQQKIERYGA